MKTAESLVVLYEIILNVKGPEAAKEFVSTAVYNVVWDIIEEGLPVTADEIDRRLEKEANDWKKMYENHKKSIA